MDLIAASRIVSTRRFLTWNINPVATNPDPVRLRAALAREDLFSSAIDLFATDTTDVADVVLPAASFLETDDLFDPYFDLALSAIVKAVEPPGQALRTARSSGGSPPPCVSTSRCFTSPIAPSSRRNRGHRARLVLEELAAVARSVASTTSSCSSRTRVRHAERQDRAGLGHGARALGLPRVPSPDADAPPAPGRLRLLSPASEWTMNASFANDPTIRRRLGPVWVALHLPTPGPVVFALAIRSPSATATRGSRQSFASRTMLSSASP